MQNRLKEAREKAKKSQMQVAIQIDTAQQQLSKWERGVQDITLEKVTKLADYYGVSIDWIAGRTENPNINR